MQDFLNFIREQGVVGLAIGFMLGGAVSKVVASLVNDIINPVIGALMGNVHGLKDASFPLLGTQILWGSFTSVIVDFIVVATVVYFGFKLLGLEKLDRKKT